ncbi:hypothetical protein E2562_021283 [Oryza meyeriana var. granulata]|uniref:Uncharacterized protein n=1 Tax=Oryza meyeriana var. granulata TaxID=110450 RepID=A0A6G1BZ04_9ORYZ|nr:hypothetical protein E2562_021283 [Oryza meyeriana var. granulata]
MSGNVPWRAALDAVYSAAITVAGGLHPWQDLMGPLSRKTLYPVFDVAIHVEVPGGAKARVCLGGHSVAAIVLFDGVVLGKGSLWHLCVEPL